MQWLKQQSSLMPVLSFLSFCPVSTACSVCEDFHTQFAVCGSVVRGVWTVVTRGACVLAFSFFCLNSCGCFISYFSLCTVCLCFLSPAALHNVFWKQRPFHFISTTTQSRHFCTSCGMAFFTISLNTLCVASLVIPSTYFLLFPSALDCALKL